MEMLLGTPLSIVCQERLFSSGEPETMLRPRRDGKHRQPHLSSSSSSSKSASTSTRCYCNSQSASKAPHFDNCEQQKACYSGRRTIFSYCSPSRWKCAGFPKLAARWCLVLSVALLLAQPVNAQENSTATLEVASSGLSNGTLSNSTVPVSSTTTPFPSGNFSTTYIPGNASSFFTNTSSELGARWANAAFQYVRDLNCSQVLYTTERECNKLTRLRKQRTNIYIAEPSEYGRFQAVLPDGPVGSASHHGVVILDPYPQMNFGHFLLIFFVDLGYPQYFCEDFRKGKYLESGECLTLGLRSKCTNSIHRYLTRTSDRAASGGASHEVEDPAATRRRRERRFVKKCEVHFLPTVVFEVSSAVDDAVINHLQCRDDVPHFAACPETRPRNETTGVTCDPLQLNHGRCETTHFLAGLDLCSRFARCDQAVMVGGGWNHLSSLQRQKTSFLEMYQFLRSYGFQRKKIAPFFGNGLPQGIPPEEGQEGTEPVPIYPAALKAAISSRIRHLCAQQYCVETLVLYLSTPSTIDGQMLLWDSNGNGIAEDSEKYSVDELLRDTESCHATSVQIIADQSFSGKIVKMLRRSQSQGKHSNVLVFSSTKESEYSLGSEFTRLWMGIDHTHSCSSHVFQHIRDDMVESTPDFAGSAEFTIFGAQCNVDPQFSEFELETYHRGCQYLPHEIVLGMQGAAASKRRRRRDASDDIAIPVEQTPTTWTAKLIELQSQLQRRRRSAMSAEVAKHTQSASLPENQL